MYSKKIKNIFLSLATSFGLFVMGLCFLTINFSFKNYVLAEDIAPSYFTAKVNTTNYTSGQSVFLDYGQKFVINFGKPIGNAIEGTTEIYGSQEDIGNYALSWEIGSFKLNINGEDIADLESYFNADLIKKTTFFYAPNYVEGDSNTFGASFEYFTIEIDLTQTTLFPTGKYEITFDNYIENSGVDYETSQTKSYSATFYVFNTTDYFSSDNATSQNLTFLNVRTVSPIGATYKNYYFFNYANITNNSTTENYLPSLSFDAGKFIVTITKSNQGASESCTISKFANNLITLGTSSVQNFVNAIYDEENEKITIYFNDIGDYRLSYQFAYENTDGSYTALTNSEITNVSKKADMMYVFGYQLNYSDSITKLEKEFKLIEDGQAGGTNSADVSYSVNYESLKNTTLSALADDTAIFTAISGKTPASTNQPAVFADYNVILNQANSYYYKLDEETNDWAKLNDAYIKNPYVNAFFTDSGTYLLKTVYTFQNNLNTNGNIASNVYFVQYFYFNISNEIVSISMNELVNNGETITEKLISTNSFTKNDVKVILPGQSIFNSVVSVDIFSKAYTSVDYPLVPTISMTATTTSQNQTFTENKNYKIVLNYVNNKKQISYFTIDDTSFENVAIYNVKASTSTNGYYTKDISNPVSFFTNKNVAVQWSEKASGATSVAYFKYIPFVQNASTLPNASQFINDNAIAVDYLMDFDVGGNELTYARYNNASKYSLLSSSYVFSEQGFYILKLSDSAGNWQYITFCIDKTQIKIGQMSNGEYRSVQNYNVVSIDTELQWGRYKLINTNIAVNQLATVVDSWVKDVFVNKLDEINGDNDILASEGKYYFAPEISSTAYVLIGNTFFQLTDIDKYVINLEKTIGDKTFANEISYVFYLIDESNPYFKLIAGLSQSDFVKNASINYKITTTSDASMANIVLNSSTTNSADVSSISYNSANLNQAGFTDSFTTDENNVAIYPKADLRTKYYFSTGATTNGDISLLSYIFMANPSENIAVEKVEVYYYPFVIEQGVYKLSSVANYTVVYDLTNSKDDTIALGGDFANYNAFNLNSVYLFATGEYSSLDGKYVVVRTYTNASTDYVSDYDFMTRESSFIIDRENIVSLPTNINGDIYSIVGQEIYVNVLDGLESSIQFTKLSSAYNTDSYILETNKLPVVVYVPVSKFGFDISENNKLFTLYNELQKFFTTTTSNELTLLNRFTLLDGTETSILDWSYFGEDNVNLTVSSNPSFDLTAVLEYSSTINGAKSVLSMTKNSRDTQNYFASQPLTQEGYYFVTISQNNINGLTYPNSYSTFSFMFYISEKKPNFDFVEILESGQDGDILNTDANNVSYTNANSVKIQWEDPIDEYMAKINLSDYNGYAKGIYYYTNINYKNYLALSDIVTDGRKHYAIIDISNLPNNTVLYVYMEYEGLQNASSNITKALYIDKVAPESVLSQMIAKTSINSINVASFSREYADNTQKYNVLKTEGTDAYSYYVFALPLNSLTLNSYFNPQRADGTYYKNGYFYNFKLVNNINTYEMTSIDSAKDPRVSHNLTISTSTLFVNNYYEVIERDLAGNISIYLIFFVQSNDNLEVLNFDKEDTEYNTISTIKYSELQETQNIFAKSYFNVTGINLYNYSWLTFSVDGITYQKSPKLANNTYFDITNWATVSALPNVVTLTQILNWESNSARHTITIIDPTKTINYTFNIFISNENLSITTLTSGEGIKINGNSYANGLTIVLSSITIYSWETDRYAQIYSGSNTFTSTNYVTFVSISNQWTFTIIEPRVAYKYIFVDNFGNANIFYHTCGEVEIPENEKIIGSVDNIVIRDDELGSETWTVGFEDIEYYYNNVDYEVYINLQVLIYNTDAKMFEWQTITPTGIIDEDYGSKVYAGVSTTYYSCSVSTKSRSINKIVLIAPNSTAGISNFAGGITRYIITLMPTKIDINGDTIQDQPNPDYILINNLSPKLSLLDKNGVNKSDLIDSDIIFSGQLTINIPRMTFNSDFVFPIITNLQFNNGEEIAINSGTCVEETGTYYIKTYIIIDNVYHLYSVHSFIISESSSNFYNVLVFNSTTNEWDIKQSTGKVFEYNNKYYSSHYIVNTQNYKVTLNEEQEIQMTEITPPYTTSEGVTTKFYEITNRTSLNKLINFYTNYIAITYISTNTLLNQNSFFYLSANGQQTNLSGVSKQIVITSENQSFTSLKIMFNSYYGIPENIININITYDDNEEYIYTPKIIKFNSTISYVTLTHSGNYTISFSDQAGNIQIFQDLVNNITDRTYKLTYINGVSFYVNGDIPIENGIYNDSVTVTLPQNLNVLYEKGSQPKITVLKNNSPITVTANSNGEYIIAGSGYYQVYFDAKINNLNVKRQITKFTIINSNEYRWAFEYSQYNNYEIISVLKNNVEMDYSNYFDYNIHTVGSASVKYLKNILISLYDEITGEGNYQITIKTNSNIENEMFTFGFKIKNFDTIPLTISAVEGTTTTNVISVSFNAYDIYNNLGECRIVVGEDTVLINQEYLDSIISTEDYYKTYNITETGTYFIQIVTDSDKVLYSYKVMKAEPLNAISIIIIICSALGASALVVTFILLRRNMKIR